MASTIVFEGNIQVKYEALGHFESVLGGGIVGLPGLGAINEDRIRRVVIRPRSAGITYTDDGTDPSASHGFPVDQDEIFVYDGRFLDRFRMSGAGADVRVIYYGT